MTPETHKGLFNPLLVSDDTEYAHFIGNGPFASQGNWGENQGQIDFFKLPTTKHKWPPRQRKKVSVRDDLHKFLPSMLSLHPTVFNGKIYYTFTNITDFLIDKINPTQLVYRITDWGKVEISHS